MKTINRDLDSDVIKKIAKEAAGLFKTILPEFKINPTQLAEDLGYSFFDDIEGEYNSVSELTQRIKSELEDVGYYNYIAFIFGFPKNDFNKILDKYGLDIDDLDELKDEMSEEQGDYRITDVVSVAILHKNRNKWIPKLASIIWKYIPEE